MIVGFREPAEADRTLKQTATEIERATAKWFWPSLTSERSRLEVSVEIVCDGSVEYEGVVDAEQYPEVRPFVSAVRTFRNGAAVEALEAPGDVVAVPILIELPAHKHGAHNAFTASVTLVARLAEPASANLDQSDHVAYFRGAGMVVEHRDLRRLSLTARPFHAALICGEANGGTANDKHVDVFLRAAEPPEHNRWTTPTDDLKNNYKLGYGQAISNLNKSVRLELRKIVGEKSVGGERGPEKLMRHFRIGSVGGGGTARANFDLVEPEATLNERGIWVFRGKVVTRVEAPNGWRANLAVRYANEDHSTGTRVAISSFDAGSLRVMIDEDKATIMVPPGVDSFEFSGTVDARRQAVEPELATLIIAANGTLIRG